MKKLILSALAVCAFGVASAQDAVATEGFSNGDVFVSGSFGFGSSKFTGNGNFKESNFSFAPRVGFFVSDNIALGVAFGYGSSKFQEEENDPEIQENTLSIGGFGRYYFTPASKFSVFGQLGFEYGSVDSDPVKVNGFGIELAPGISYFLNKNFAIEATWGALNYSSAKEDFNGAQESTDFNLGLDLDNINFGLLYKF